MSETHTRNHVVIKRFAGSKNKFTLHRSFNTQGEARHVAKEMKEEGRYDTKAIMRKNLASYT